ncbi:MAG: putative DNA binding domain-containing protein [Clostridiales Family XIII bacterium]|nr:putative DNA binding domain-containing protein [Clostridiales Family XIII bacterium]
MERIDMEFDLNNAEQYREGNRIEAKSARGGLPHSLWETYSSFANTNGGIILLGVNELKDGTLIPFYLKDTDKLIFEFWNNINNSQVVNINILTDDNIQVVDDGQFRFVVIAVPRADRRSKPVYTGQDPFKGTFRRNGQGDYHCKKEEILAMFRDQADVPQDMTALEKISLNAINRETVSMYRRRFELVRPEHVWVNLTDDEFLLRLGAVDAVNEGERHPTAAGLLMFGDEYQIVREFPNYFLDYREIEPWQERWVHRFVSNSGEWSGNLYDFFYRTYNRIAQIIEVPFKLVPGEPERIEDTPVHKAIREVLANTLIKCRLLWQTGACRHSRATRHFSIQSGGFPYSY